MKQRRNHAQTALIDNPDGLLASSEAALARLAVDLGAGRFGGDLSLAERRLVERVNRDHNATTPAASLQRARALISAGEDPLGRAFCALRSPTVRRATGAVYTPAEIVRPMVSWALGFDPWRVVDAGSGSGRFSAEVARRSPDTRIIAVDSDPLAALLTRATLAVIGHKRTRVLHADYITVQLPVAHGRTAFIGNPPYVRHHDLSARAKNWAQAASRQLGHNVSGLAGLHAYFFLSTALLGAPGDVGCFVTSAEWLDVNYGSIIRGLLLDGLGGHAIHMLEPTAAPFEGAATTAAITCFRLGEGGKSIQLRRVKRVADLDPLEGGRPVARRRLASATRWTPLVRRAPRVPYGYIELGELCRVHRGAVTGGNAVWITGSDDDSLPASVLFAAVTKARELFAAGNTLVSDRHLRRVIDIPRDLDAMDQRERAVVETFLRRARRAGAGDGYIARTRKAWWSVGLREPAPILATYMARRAPAFVRNLAAARHVNIAHGIYPRFAMSDAQLDALAAALRQSASVGQGRTYAGGLTKFEPREMERIVVPDVTTRLVSE